MDRLAPRRRDRHIALALPKLETAADPNVTCLTMSYLR